MAYATSTRALRVPFGERLAALITAFREANARRALYAQTLQELNALSDRDLSDLGMSRASIAHVARQAAYGH